MISGKRLWNLALIEALVTEREGMVADNAQRAHVGESMAYVGNDFQVIADRLRAFAASPAEPLTKSWSVGDKPACAHLKTEVVSFRDGAEIERCQDCGATVDSKQKPAVTVEEVEAVKRHALTCLVVDCPVRSHLAIAAYRPAPAEPECKHGAWPLCKDDPPCGDCPKCKPAPRAEGK